MRPKFKVLELDWYVVFGLGRKLTKPYHGDLYEDEKVIQSTTENYDGPLHYIEPCPDLPYPAREGVKYCVRTGPSLHKQRPSHPGLPEFRGYVCYCYQLGRWWRYKKMQWLFAEIHVPRMSLYDYTRLRTPRKFLRAEYQTDVTFYTIQNSYFEKMRKRASLRHQLHNPNKKCIKKLPLP